MAVPLIVNGVTYQYPELTDEGWGPDSTNWAVAITQGTLQKSGGLFSLTGDVDFGPSFGLKTIYLKSRSSNIALSGQIRLSNSDFIAFRNSANSADLAFKPGSTDSVPQYNGIDLVNLSTTQSLTNKTLVGAIFTGGILNSPTINTPTVSGGAFSGPNISSPVVTGGTFSNPTITGQGLFANGTPTAPSISFTSEPTLGFSKDASGSIELSSSDPSRARLILNTVTANASASIILNSTGGGTGDQLISFGESSSDTGAWSLGRDDSNSSAFTLSQKLGDVGNTNNYLLVTTSGAFTFGAPNTGQAHTFNGKSVTVRGATTGTDPVSLDVAANSASAGSVIVSVNGNAAGSSDLMFQGTDGTGNWFATGYDDSANKYVIAIATNGSPNLGTSSTDMFTITTAGAITIGASGGTQTHTVNGNLSITGSSSFSNPLLISNGTVANPGLAFSSEPNTGIFRSSGGAIDVSIVGTEVAQFNPGGLTIGVNGAGTQRLFLPNGSVGAPSLTFLSSPTTGLYTPSTDTLRIATAGADTAEFASGQIRGTNGTANSPSFTFISDSDTGMYHSATNEIAFSAGNQLALKINPNGIEPQLQIKQINGSAANPSYSFINDTSSGMFKDAAANTLLFSTGGVTRLQIQGSNYIETLLPIHYQDGSVSAPSITFTNESNTGFFRSSANVLAVAVGGTDVIEFRGAGASSRTRIVNGQISVPDGTAAAPSYTFENEQNTGFYRDSSGSFMASVLGVNKLQISTDLTAFTNVDVRFGSSLKLLDSSNTNYISLNAPTSVPAPYAITFPAAAPGSNTALVYNGTNYVWNAIGGPVVNSVTLTDNTTNGTAISFISASTNTVFIKYSLKRGANFQTGELKIVNDGTAPQIVDESLQIGDCGTTFSVDISGANLRLLYTTTSTGTNVSMKYTVESWQA